MSLFDSVVPHTSVSTGKRTAAGHLRFATNTLCCDIGSLWLDVPDLHCGGFISVPASEHGTKTYPFTQTVRDKRRTALDTKIRERDNLVAERGLPSFAAQVGRERKNVPDKIWNRNNMIETMRTEEHQDMVALIEAWTTADLNLARDGILARLTQWGFVASLGDDVLRGW
ncbi:hypothetical protein P280DRAFT_523089 [Massarina eburnea CBS 473.64]|uniref:Uncharacterized protein n=1 Tax=Massarina eburnea CBS 473.64 TaxID=1395130 RepID=A0A6A6RKK8_9PLEO|nr:hypothetical protein P280DRAFT_523089 [Massarina eburnea CBS 473.64]